MKKTLLSGIGILLLSGMMLMNACKKKDRESNCSCDLSAIESNQCTTDTNEIIAMLNGSFDWKASYNPWTGLNETPQSSGKMESVEFLSNHQVKVYRNGNYYADGYWWLEQQSGTKLNITDSLYHPFSDSVQYSGWVRKCGGCLVIDLSPVDGMRVTFGKK